MAEEKVEVMEEVPKGEKSSFQASFIIIIIKVYKPCKMGLFAFKRSFQNECIKYRYR